MLGISNVVLFCLDTERSRAFYAAAGLPWLRGFEGMHWFDLGGSELMLHPSDRTISGHGPEVAVRCENLDAAFARCRDADLGPMHHQVPQELTAPHTTPWGTREFQLDDPDGHRWTFVAV